MAALDTTLGGILSLCIVFMFLTTTTIVLRFAARHKQNANYQVDDWMIVVAWIFFAGLNALIYYGIHLHYIGYKQPKNKTIINEEHPTVVRVFLALDGLGIITLGLTKLSALFFYRRIFCSHGINNVFNIVSLGFIVVVVIWTVVFFVLTLNFCIGHNIQYNFPVGNSANCKLIYPWFEASTTSDFGLDVLILALPLPKVRQLLEENLGVAASIARMTFLVYKIRTGRTINDVDGYQSNTQLAYFLILETGMTILAVNIPSLWYFLRGITPERVLRSVRSLVSLRSVGSSTKGNSVKGSKASIPKSSAMKQSTDIHSSQTDLTGHASSSKVEAFEMDGLRTERDRDGIHVKRTFQQVEEEV